MIKHILFAMTLAFVMDTGLAQEPPNIIFLLADDLRDNMFSADGHPVVQTPHIDQLLAKSVRFTNTYIAEPVCSPSRVSLLTGLYERVHGIGFSSSYQLTEEQWQQTYPSILRENGYFTGFVGKIGIEYYTFKDQVADKFDYWYGHNGWTRFFPKDHNSPSCEPYHQATNDIITPIMSEGIEGFLDKIPEDQPFCLSVSFNVPHGSQTTSMYPDYEDWRSMSRPANQNPKLQGHPLYDSQYRDSQIQLPAATATDPYHHIPQHILDQDQGRRNQTYTYSYTKETSLEHHIRYYQVITGLDQAIGQLMEQLRQQGLEENTIIIFASDHGLLMGEYGMGGKALLYDITSKIPCFVYDPTISPSLKGRKNPELVSSLDIPATILDYAGLADAVPMQGQSLEPLVTGENVEWREELFLESLFTLRDNPFCEGIRQGKWKYIRMYDGAMDYDEQDVDFKSRSPEFEQLFDLEQDPGEEKNLINEHQGSELLKQLRSKVQGYSEKINQQREQYMQNTKVARR